MKLLITAGLIWAFSSNAFAEETTTPERAEPIMETATSAIASEEALKPRLPLNELRVFAEAFNRISSAYVEEIDDKTLLEYAIIGMLSQLDPHSAYLDKDSFDELQESTTGNYGGLGLEIGMEDGFVKVISPMDDTPADKAGIESGDLIVQLDGTPVKGMNLSEAIEVMRGEPGSTITVTVVKEGASGPTELTLTREVIKVASVRQRYLEDGYGYLRVAQFQAGTGDEVDKAIIRLKDAGDLDGLIIDLRNNPGGVLQAAVDVSNAFMDEGLIVYTQGRVDDAEIRYSANTPDSVNGIPIVVLVNEGSASASEIVAGALQDHGRAIIMGTDTFGKGSVQTILPLSKEKAIKLTTARYYTPNGKSIQAEGITPDIWVDRSTVTPVKRGPWRFKEKDLSKHLENDDVADADEAEEQAEQTDRQNSIELASRDYQLNEALTLLKGLHIPKRQDTTARVTIAEASNSGSFILLAALLLLTAPLPSLSSDASTITANAFIAVIIDDIGHNRQHAERMFDIPAPLTFAVIPETAYAEPLARQAYLSGKEVMVHLPMENTHNRPMERLQLTAEHSRQEFELILDEAIARVPYATGMNNHMGSALTEMPQAMSWLMRSIRKHQMYFIDSRTTPRSVAQKIAQQENLKTASRDIFLDNIRTFYGIDTQFQKLLSVAKRKKTAIAIGHPYPTTIDYLARAIPQLEEQGIRVVPVSELIRIRSEMDISEPQVAALFPMPGAD